MKKVDVFNKIRNYPYHISVNGELGFDCEDKSKMLVEEFRKEGIETRLRIGLFNWSVLDLPESVVNVKHDKEYSHCFVEVKNSEGVWVFVDPTWNPELSKAGFAIANWDGENETILAMDCYKILSPEESVEYMNKIDYEDDMKNNRGFYRALNEYCDGFK